MQQSKIVKSDGTVTTNRGSSLETEKQTNHEKPVPTCPICARKFTQVSHLNHHKRFVKCIPKIQDDVKIGMVKVEDVKEESFSDDSQEQSTDTTTSITKLAITTPRIPVENISNSTNESKYECSVCGKFLSTKKTLLKHVKFTHNPPKYKCPGCTRKFTRLDLAKRHWNAGSCKFGPGNKNPVKPTKYQCALCTMTFKTRTLLVAHNEDIHKEPIHECTLCTRKFASHVNLTLHMKSTHCPMESAGLSVSPMESAGLSVRSEASVADHAMQIQTTDTNDSERVITPTTPTNNVPTTSVIAGRHECSVCGQTLSTKAHHTRHMKSHQTPRHECSGCSLKFSRLDLLKRHMKICKFKRKMDSTDQSELYSLKTLDDDGTNWISIAESDSDNQSSHGASTDSYDLESVKQESVIEDDPDTHAQKLEAAELIKSACQDIFADIKAEKFPDAMETVADANHNKLFEIETETFADIKAEEFPDMIKNVTDANQNKLSETETETFTEVDFNEPKCTFCVETFPSVLEMEEHSLEIHGEKYRCSSCEQTFMSRDNFQIHTLLEDCANKEEMEIADESEDYDSLNTVEVEYAERSDDDDNLNYVEESDNDIVSDIESMEQSNVDNLNNPESTEPSDNGDILITDQSEKSQKKITDRSDVLREITGGGGDNGITEDVPKDEESRRDAKSGSTDNERSSSHQERHLNYESVPRYKCFECDKTLISRGNLKRHIQCKHQQNIRYFECHKCKFKSTRKDNMKRHMLHHKDDTKAELTNDYEEKGCTFCESKFDMWTKVEAHSLKEHGARYMCFICKKTFMSVWRDFVRHITKMHSLDKTEKCDCGKKFHTKKDLRIHQRNTHSKKATQPVNMCDECGCSYTSSTGLRMHKMWKHQAEEPLKCIDCGKCFICTSSLNEHIRVYHNNERFQCSICPKRYYHMASLKRHVHVEHTPGENRHNRQVVCQYCEKRFKSKANLKKHEKYVHLNVSRRTQTHTCKECGAVVKNMEIHMRIHSSEANFSCDVCSKAFKFKHHLQNHLSTKHSDERPFPCTKCDLRFKMAHHLRAHIDRKH